MSRTSYVSIVSMLTLTFALHVTGQTNLKQFAQEQAQKWRTERAIAESLAKKMNLPIRTERTDGTIIELQRFVGGRPMYYITDNLTAAKTVSTNKIWTGGGNGFSLTGANDTLGEWDGGGIRTTHREFSGRIITTEGSVSQHSTHVAGTLIGAGIDGNAKGMSYQAKLMAYDWNNDVSEMALAASNGLRVSNHSYGLITGWNYNTFNDNRWVWYGDSTVSDVEDYRFGYYNGESQSWDNVAYNAPYYLISKSAGNDRNEGPSIAVTHWVNIDGNWVLRTKARNPDGGFSGYDCINGAGVSKNILTVGAVGDIATGYTTPSSVVMSTFSSWGPTDDGRIKPDICANGVGLYSSIETADNTYGSLSGTSMASPNAAGSIGLLLDYQKILHGSTPMRSSSMKAILINTADESGPSSGPDYKFGWGLLNTLHAAQIMRQDSADGFGSHIRELSLSQNDTISIVLKSTGIQPLKASIVWTDPAHSVPTPLLNATTPMLVNDLDLRVTKRKDNSVSYPWMLDRSNPTQAATTGDNIRDNVEQVYIASPSRGVYTLRITHKGTLSGGPQNVSLVVNGNINTIGPLTTVSRSIFSYDIIPGEVFQDSIVVHNDGDTTLFLTPNSLIGWLSSENINVPQNDSATLHFSVDASVLQQWHDYDGTVTLNSNDTSQASIPIAVHLHVQGPKIIASATSLLVSADSNTVIYDTVKIRNTGFIPLQYSIGGALPSWLSPNPNSGTVAVGDTALIVLTLNDSSLSSGVYNTTVSIENTDSSTGTVGIPLIFYVDRHITIFNVNRSWNIVSIPAIPVSPVKSDLFPTSTSFAFSFDGGYVSNDTLRKGKGYWLRFNSDQPVVTDGVALIDDTVLVSAGWNLIGATSRSTAVSSITSDVPNMITSYFYGYNGGYQATDSLRTGKGYWVKVNQAGKLFVSSSTQQFSANHIQVRPSSELPPSPPEVEPTSVNIPSEFLLHQNYPNPFNPTTTIRYDLPQDEYVTLKIYNVLGVEVANVVNGYQSAGSKVVELDASELPTGMYFYRLQAGQATAIRKMILMK